MYNREIMDNEQPDQWLTDLPTRAENAAFDAAEMIHCEKCARANPPNRLKCLYCGAELNLPEELIQNIQPNSRKLEFWEKGFNLIFEPHLQSPGKIDLSKAAKSLKVETELLQKICEHNKALPLARVESQKEAEIIKDNLAAIGLEIRIVSDETLAAEKSPRRLRGIEFSDEKIILILFNQDEIVEIANEDLLLIVSGAIFERKIEATEKRSKKGESKILDSRETASDESLLDIYSRADSDGFRIWAKGFDFSGLEREKSILAMDNMKKLTEKLLKIAPNAKFIADYMQNREILADVWEVEQKSESQGWKRESFGKFNLGNITTINNLTQFTKYSRLQRQIL